RGSLSSDRSAAARTGYVAELVHTGISRLDGVRVARSAHSGIESALLGRDRGERTAGAERCGTRRRGGAHRAWSLPIARVAARCAATGASRTVPARRARRVERCDAPGATSRVQPRTAGDRERESRAVEAVAATSRRGDSTRVRLCGSRPDDLWRELLAYALRQSDSKSVSAQVRRMGRDPPLHS